MAALIQQIDHDALEDEGDLAEHLVVDAAAGAVYPDANPADGSQIAICWTTSPSNGRYKVYRRTTSILGSVKIDLVTKVPKLDQARRLAKAMGVHEVLERQMNLCVAAA